MEVPLLISNFILICLWWFLSFLCNVFATYVLRHAQQPVTASYLTAMQCCTGFFGCLIFGNLSMRNLWEKLKRLQLFSKPCWAILCVGLCHLLGNLCTNVSLSMINTSFVHTIKAVEPLLSAYLGARFLGEKHSQGLYVGTGLVVGGVLMSSLSFDQFNSFGFASAVLSSMAFAIRNLQTKVLMRDHSFNESEVFLCMSGIGVMFSWINLSPVSSRNADQVVHGSGHILLYACLCHYMYNTFSFIFLGRISLLGHAVSNTLKRAFLVLSTAIFFGTWSHMSTPHLLGSLCACAGAGCYSVLKACSSTGHGSVGGASVSRSDAANSWRQALFVVIVVGTIVAGTRDLAAVQHPSSAAGVQDGSQAALITAANERSLGLSSRINASMNEQLPVAAIKTEIHFGVVGEGAPRTMEKLAQLPTTTAGAAGQQAAAITSSAADTQMVPKRTERTKPTKKILIISGAGNGNLGDDEQPWVWLQHLKHMTSLSIYFAAQVADKDQVEINTTTAEDANFGVAKCPVTMPVSLASAGWTEGSYVHPICVRRRVDQPPILAFAQFDGFIYGAGGLFATNSYVSFASPAMLAAMAQHTPVYLLSVGCFLPDAALYAGLLKLATVVGVRDDESKEALQLLATNWTAAEQSDLPARMAMIPDPILCLPASALPVSLRKQSEMVQDISVLTGTSVAGRKPLRVCWAFKFYKQHRTYIQRTLAEGWRPGDRIFSLGGEGTAVIDSFLGNLTVDHSYTSLLHTAMFMRRECDMVMSMVLHALILSVRIGVPVLGGMGGKLRGALNWLGPSISEPCFSNDNVPTRALLQQCYLATHQHRDQAHKHLASSCQILHVALQTFDRLVIDSDSQSVDTIPVANRTTTGKQ